MCKDTIVIEDKTDLMFRVLRLPGPRVFPRKKKNTVIILSYNQLEYHANQFYQGQERSNVRLEVSEIGLLFIHVKHAV